MNDGLAFSALNAREQEKLQTELLWELKRLILKFNRGSGNSVRTETAEEIFRSMMYCVSLYLGQTPDPAEAVRRVPGGELFRKALDAVRGEVNRAKLLYREAVATRIPTDLPVYNEMLGEGLSAFFQLYDPEFAAQETPPGMMVYPLLHEPEGLGGVSYVIAYLREVIAENGLCRNYSRNHIRAVLLLYGRKYRLDYHDLVVNIPEVLAESDRHVKNVRAGECKREIVAESGNNGEK